MKQVSLSQIIGKDGIFIDGDWIESKDQDPSGSVRLIQLADIGEGTFINKSNRYLTPEKALELKCTFLTPGDVLIARMPDPIGRACIFPKLDTRCVTVVDVCIVRPDIKAVLPEWLMYKINDQQFRRQIQKYVTGTTRQRISRSNLEKIKFDVPSLEEQKRTVRMLDQAKSLGQKRKQAINLLDEYLKSVYFEMFGDQNTNSKNWNLKMLDEISDICSGVTKGRKFGNSKTVHTPYMRVANVQDERIDLSEIKEIEVLPSDVEKYRLIIGDLLLTEGGDPDKLGRGGIWRGEVDNCIHQNHIFRVRLNNQVALPEYISAQIGSARGKKYFLKSAKQTTGIATININST